MQSSLKPITCLQWTFKRPCNGGTRTSGYFSMLGDKWCLVVSLKTQSLTSDCCVRLQSRAGKEPADASLSVTCHFMAREKIHGYFPSTAVSSDQIIFHVSLENAEITPKEEDEFWTVFCMLTCNTPLSLQVGNETIQLSTADDKNEPSIDFKNVPLVDQSVQVSSSIPENIEALSFDISRLLEEEISPDFTLKCGGWIFPVHRSVLAARSRVFRRKLGNTSHQYGGSDDIDDLEAPVLAQLLKFLYSGKLEAEDLSVILVGDLYDAANKYGVRSLVTTCSDYMKKNLSLENCVRYLDFSVTHSDLELHKAATSFILSHKSVFKSEAWMIFLRDHIKEGCAILQTNAAGGRKRSGSVKQEPSTSKSRKTQSSSRR